MQFYPLLPPKFPISNDPKSAVSMGTQSNPDGSGEYGFRFPVTTSNGVMPPGFHSLILKTLKNSPLDARANVIQFLDQDGFNLNVKGPLVVEKSVTTRDSWYVQLSSGLYLNGGITGTIGTESVSGPITYLKPYVLFNLGTFLQPWAGPVISKMTCHLFDDTFSSFRIANTSNGGAYRWFSLGI